MRANITTLHAHKLCELKKRNRQMEVFRQAMEVGIYNVIVGIQISAERKEEPN